VSSTTNVWTASPWVEEHRDRVTFALQVFPIDTPVDPGMHLLAAGRLAEELGFDAFFVGDHPAWALDPWLHLAALAVTTERIRLGLNVCCALYRHPVLTARLAADLDNLSRGRLILGLGTGWDANEFANLGLPFPPAPERQAALAEAIEIIRGVWGEHPFTFEGQHFRCTGARVRPQPVQRPGPPTFIAGGGERVTLRQVVQHADACNVLQIDPFAEGLLGLDAIARKFAALRAHCENLGRPFDTVLRTYTTGWMILGEDERALQSKLAHYFPDGIDKRYRGLWRDYVLPVTPDRAVAHFQALREAGVQYFIVETLDATDHDTIRLLATDVIPRVASSGG
jgi:alkanesulfonate monooxygenase SsuD/methylene tetrahydromethanopterin reductase-like flavin-dependent oxidoreductase (luciferase family)